MNIVFDLDGTLADLTHRVHYLEQTPKNWNAFFDECNRDLPILPIIQTLKDLRKASNIIEIWTARNGSTRDMTIHWLRQQEVFINAERFPPFFTTIPGVALRMRHKDERIDDHELKRRWLHQSRAEGRYPDIVFDDRQRVVDMWRSEGIICLQVNPGDF